MLDLTGKKLGMLTVISELPHRGQLRYWLCRCDCGSTAFGVYQGSLTRRNRPTTSCGCVQRTRAKLAATKHGQAKRGAKSKLYITWRNIKERCYNHNSTSYRNYGARGIRMFAAWREDFSAFSRDVGDPPSTEHSIERIDNDGNYGPGNVRWATKNEQAQNTRVARLVVFNGQVKTVSEWANVLGIPRGTLSSRLKRGWTDERAVTTPLRR